MKVVLLAGGFGTRISEESDRKPKPMIEIGGKPILWHIMKIYSSYGFNDFVVCAGYKSYVVKEYFSNYFLHMSDVTFDMSNNRMTVHAQKAEPWKVTIIDTGLETMTGGRIKRIREYIGDEPFMVTYGDGVADVDIGKLLAYHREHGRVGTMTAVQPAGRFGALQLGDDNTVLAFKEKPKGDGSWINGGFFVFNKDIFDYIDGDDTVFEKEPLECLSKKGELVVYKHEGFWQPMDTLRDKQKLEELWDSGRAPWNTW